jgi:hypothetical protein
MYAGLATKPEPETSPQAASPWIFHLRERQEDVHVGAEIACILMLFMRDIKQSVLYILLSRNLFFLTRLDDHSIR